MSHSLIWRLILPVPIVFGAGLLFVWNYFQNEIEETVRLEAVRNAQTIAMQFRTLRRYYTQSVVDKILSNSQLQVTSEHHNDPNAVPLPATLIHDISDQIKDENTTLKLFSPYPFPNRAGRGLDSFQKEAWAHLSENAGDIFVRRDHMNNQEVIRVALADRMVAEACVECHNTHPQSPKTDWQLHEVRGILEVATLIDNQLAAGHRLGWNLIAAVALCGLVVILTYLLFARSLIIPIASITETMRRLARGERQIDIPARNRDDEIGTMANALQVFKEHAEELDRFTYATSHDLKAPLTTISGLIEFIEDDLEEGRNKEVKMNLKRLRELSDRLGNLVENLLVLAKSDHADATYDTVDIEAVAEDIFDQLTVMARSQGVTLALKQKHGRVPAVDRNRLSQALSNLISNAIKFADRNKDDRFVEVTTASDPHFFYISVQDNGLGIPEQYQNQVFGYFKRFHDKSVSGSGLGLSLVKKHVERMGGSIRFESSQQGTCFTICLPLERRWKGIIEPAEVA